MKKIIIFDFNRTLYDPEQERIMPEALTILEYLSSKNYELILVSRAVQNRKVLINKLGITPYFNKIIIANNKSLKLFNKIIGAKPTVIIGDRVKTEITLGNQLGATTIWFKNGKFKDEIPNNNMEKPNYIITNLKQIKTILK